MDNCERCGTAVEGWDVEEHLDDPRLETFVPATSEKITLHPCGHTSIRAITPAR